MFSGSLPAADSTADITDGPLRAQERARQVDIGAESQSDNTGTRLPDRDIRAGAARAIWTSFCGTEQAAKVLTFANRKK
jgi:hypothetical protein